MHDTTILDHCVNIGSNTGNSVGDLNKRRQYQNEVIFSSVVRFYQICS